MTWSWSHTGEAYTTLRARILNMPRAEREIIFAEWKAVPGGVFKPGTFARDGFDERRYQRALAAAKYLGDSDLSERIFDLAERLSDCTNGGWEAHLCPHHCGPHTIAWSSEEKVDGDEGDHVCLECQEDVSTAKKVWHLSDYTESAPEHARPFCSRQCAQEYEHKLACGVLS